MNINFPLILLLLVCLGVFIWLLDVFWLRKRRPADQPEGAIVENAKALTPILVLVFVIRSFLYEPFQIPSGSMIPTLLVGDFILVNKYTYGLRLPVWRNKVVDINEPEKGDVMVFFPPGKDQYYIKRVIGVPGDIIEYTDKVLTINGKVQPQTFIEIAPRLDNPYRSREVNTEVLNGVEHEMQNYIDVKVPDFKVVVKDDHYFMMGDNRDNSLDSRAWGQVHEDRIVGKAVAVWMHKEPGLNLPSFSTVRGIQ